MPNSVDPDQTAPVPGPRYLLLYLIFSNVWQLFAADDSSRQHFQMHFFLGALRVKKQFSQVKSKFYSRPPNLGYVLTSLTGGHHLSLTCVRVKSS